MAKELTKRQKQVLQFIIDYINDNEYPPSFREIGRHLDITSTKGVTDHLEVLQRKGYIERINNQSRSIRVLKYPDEHMSAIPAGKIPVYGRIAAGSPIFDEGNLDEFLDLEPSVFGRGTVFALKVKGDSMINAHICDGDLAILRKQDKVENGEIAAVMVEGIQDEATLKRFHRTSSLIELRAANASYPVIKVDPKKDKVQILGKLVGIIRQH